MQKIELESSQISRQGHSQSVSIALNGRDSSIKTSSSFFPLFDQITKLTSMLNIISYIVTFFFYLQVIFSATWPYIEFYQKNEKNNSESVIEKETLIFWFLRRDLTFSSTRDSIIISLVIFLICSIWFSFIGLFYHYRRRFIKWTLYPTRFIFEIVSPIFLHPSAAAAGSAIMNIINNYKDGLSWLYAIIGIIVYCGFLLYFYFGYSLLCNSVVLCTSMMSTYEPFYMILLSSTSSLMVLLSFLFYTFDKWIINVLQAIHFAVFLFILINLFNLHFHKLNGTILAFSTLTTSCALDVLMFALNLISKAPVLIPIICSYALFVVLIIVGAFVIKFYYKKAVKKLKLEEDEDAENQDLEYTNLFRSLQIDKKKSKALKFLRVGLMSMAKPILDCSLIKFIITNYQDDSQILCALLQVLSFFPSQIQFVNNIFTLIIKKKNLKFPQKFLVYQAHRVKVMRQSSIPIEANERILQLRINSRDCEYTINSLWGAKVTPVIGLFETINKITDKTDGLWQEGIRDYPNNVKFSEEYCCFLTECKTDFKNAIVQKHRVDLIERGFNFSSDYAFKKFIQNYPSYLKKKVLDTTGRFIKGNNGHANSGNASSSSSSSSKSNSRNDGSSYSASSMDFELEMTHAKSLFSQSKLRMSLYNALKKSKLTLSKVMIATAVITLIAAVAGFLTIDIMIKEKMRNRSLDSSNSNLIQEAYFNLNIACLHHLLGFAVFTGVYPVTGLLYLLKLSSFDTLAEIPSKIYISFLGTIRENSYPFFFLSEDQFQDFLDLLSEQATDGLNIYRMAGAILNPTVEQVAFRDLVQSELFNRTMKDSFSDIYFDLLRLTEKPINALFTTDAFLEITLNLFLMADPFMSIFNTLLTEQYASYNKFKSDMKLIQIIIPIVIFCIQFLPFFIVGVMFSARMKKFAKLLIGLDSNTKEACKRKILLNSDNKDDTYQSDHIEVSHTWIILLVLHTLFSIASFILLFYMIYISIQTNEVFQKINAWQYLSAERYIYSIEITHFTYQVLFNYQNKTSIYINNEAIIDKIINTFIEVMKTSNINLLKGSSFSESVIGFDQYFDNLNSKEVCQIDTSFSDSIHDLYYCASASQAVNIFADMALTVLTNVDSYEGKVVDQLVVNLLHMANTHLFDRLADSNSRLVDLIDIHYNKSCQNTDIFMAIGIIVGAALLIFQVCSSIYSNKLYHVGLSLVRRIPPTLFVADKELLNFVLNKRSMNSSNVICPSQSVILNANDGMVGVNSDGTIEMINPALTNILGYTPEQLLGQPITEIFTTESGEQVSQQMIAMTNGESSLITEDHFVCISDSANEVHCHIFIIGLKGKASRLDSFTFLVQDESSLIEQQTIAEKAKAQSEALLFQILPRSIVTKLNRGEHDISFTVPSASIIFTDIVRFSDYSVNLQPADVMGNLSQIFSSFDDAAKKYPLLTKIKLIGDIYMAAAGLFITEEEATPPNQHAEQTIRFGLDCLQAIEENNVKLDSSLQLRIGVNSGGPLIAGVLGSDKPVFDIIGDPINVAARLQTTDLPGRIQVPQSTYELIANSGFLVEERGEVFLKGKGKTMAYFVNPLSLDITSLADENAV